MAGPAILLGTIIKTVNSYTSTYRSLKTTDEIYGKMLEALGISHKIGQSEVSEGFRNTIDKLNSAEANIIEGIQAEKYRTLVSSIDNFWKDLDSCLESYSQEHLFEELDQRYNKIKDLQIELKLVSYLDDDFLGSGNFLESYVRKAREDSKDSTLDLKTSVAKKIYDLNFLLRNKIFSATTLLLTIMSLKSRLKSTDKDQAEIKFISTRHTNALRDLEIKMRNFFFESMKVEDCIYYGRLKPSPVLEYDGDLLIYDGKIEVNEPDHVITGLRFVQISNPEVFLFAKIKDERRHFLQIQTAKLLPHGQVDESTIKWQALPEKFEQDDFVSCTYFITCFGSFENHAVTGIQIIEGEDTEETPWYKKLSSQVDTFASLKIFGKKIDFQSGTLAKDAEEMDLLSEEDSIKGVNVEEYVGKKKLIIEDTRMVYVESKSFVDSNVGTNLDGAEVSMNAPVKGVGIMLNPYNNGKNGTLRPYLKTVDYKELI